MTASSTPGTSDIVVCSPALGAPWDYGPGIDLHGAQFTPRWRRPRRPRPARNRNYPDGEAPAAPAPRYGGRP